MRIHMIIMKASSIHKMKNIHEAGVTIIELKNIA